MEEPEDDLLPSREPSTEVQEETPRPRSGPNAMTAVITQGLVGLALLLLVFLTPLSISVVEEIVAVGLLAYAFSEAWRAYRRDGTGIDYLRPGIVFASGLTLVVWPGETLVVAGYALGATLAIFGLLNVWQAVRGFPAIDAPTTWVLVRGLLLLAVGGVAALFPDQTVEVVVIGISLMSVGRAAIALWSFSRGGTRHAGVDPTDTSEIVRLWLAEREMDTATAKDIESRVFLHHGNFKDRASRFAILLGLATTIATFGIAADSTAVVIGAMLLAPLMTPILGTAAGLIRGQTRSAMISAGIALGGIAGTIALSWALTIAIPDLGAVIQNSQVVSRTAPSLGDLIIALAAGAAGAYGVSRAESTDALPGVAVAIALVPPLAVVGITLHAGDLAQAGGALLLFLTNLFSIILMAGLVFVIVGYSSWANLSGEYQTIRLSFAAVMLAVILIMVPLALTAQGIVQRSTNLRTATDAVSEWLGESPMRISGIDHEGDTVTVRLVGPGEPPPPAELSRSLRQELGEATSTVLWWVEEQGGVVSP